MKTDSKVLSLKKIVEEKKANLKKVSFQPRTNCSIKWVGQSVNLHVATMPELVVTLGLLQSVVNATPVELHSYLLLGSFTFQEYLEDIRSKIAVLEYQADLAELRRYQTKLDELLSSEAKVDLELQELEELIKG